MKSRTRQGRARRTALSGALSVCLIVIVAAGCTPVDADPAPGAPAAGAASPQGSSPSPSPVQGPATPGTWPAASESSATGVWTPVAPTVVVSPPPAAEVDSSVASRTLAPVGAAGSPGRPVSPDGRRPLPAVRAVLEEAAPGEYLATLDPDDAASCGGCVCPDAGCACRLLRSGECLCTFVEGGDDCSCDCRGLPTTTQVDQMGSTGSPVGEPATEAP